MRLEVVREPESHGYMGWLAESTVRRVGSLEEAAAQLQRLFPHCYVYVGGRHVSVHWASGDPRRLVFVRQVKSAVQLEAEAFRERCEAGDPTAIAQAEQ